MLGPDDRSCIPILATNITSENLNLSCTRLRASPFADVGASSY